MIKQGDTIYAFYKSTNKSFNVEWISATVITAKEHFVECRRSEKGRPMRVAYEHIRLVPSNYLEREIVEPYFEDDISEMKARKMQTI